MACLYSGLSLMDSPLLDTAARQPFYFLIFSFIFFFILYLCPPKARYE